ncbi:MAG: hypothetical protein EKK47_16570 [Burkholderiales bacterium]|nr:MAG: hypothetical protein EKK47_16570 [Burkholderiales bacterium]
MSGARKNKAADFLQNMAHELQTEPPAPVRQVDEWKGQAAPSRAGLKHIGGYFAVETVEKVAVLRARLSLDNSELLKQAIDELYMKHAAKRAFGDL